MSEVKAGQMGGRREAARSDGGRGPCCPERTVPVQAALQTVTSACSCAGTFAGFTGLLCGVENSWAETVTHTERGLATESTGPGSEETSVWLQDA